MHTIKLLLLLLLAPGPSSSAPSASPYEDTLAQLARADTGASQDPDQGAAALLEALVRLTQFPTDVAGDPAAQALQSLAQLNLARSYLLLGRPEQAGVTIDEAIRTAQTRDLPVAMFGPSMESLYQERLAQMQAAGKARLLVDCTIPCRVFVNERKVQTAITWPLRF